MIKRNRAIRNGMANQKRKTRAENYTPESTECVERLSYFECVSLLGKESVGRMLWD